MGSDVLPTKRNDAFAIYFLKDTTLKMRVILNTRLEDLELADIPWLSQDDIDFYDWSSHCIYLKKDKSKLFPNYYEGYYQLPTSWTDRPWIVVANNVPCYRGYFLTDASIDAFPFPEISALEAGTWGYPKDVIASDWIWRFHSDPRDNELVKSALVQSGLYHGGIDVSLDTIDSPIRIFNDDTSSIEYTIKIKNDDLNDLYVFDPDSVESEIFHWYNNGPAFSSINTYENYDSRYKKTKKPNAWDNNWYTLLQAGGSMRRTIRLRGYPTIPPGRYLIQLLYSCPREGLNKSIREGLLGRYWMGQVRSNLVLLTIDTSKSAKW